MYAAKINLLIKQQAFQAERVKGAVEDGDARTAPGGPRGALAEPLLCSTQPGTMLGEDNVDAAKRHAKIFHTYTQFSADFKYIRLGLCKGCTV